MTGKFMQRAAVCAAAAVAIAVSAPAALDARQDPAAMSGKWKLNVEASTNPNGPATGRARGGGGGGRDAGSGGNYASGASGSTTDRTTLSAEEQQRLDLTKKMLWTAPTILTVEASATDVQIAYESAQPFKQAANNKAAEIKETPIGPLQIKAKWDKAKLHREIETRDAIKVTEDYELSPDGKQLFVTIKTESRVVRNVQTAPIRRVYDRAQ
jgi:hypothetical protein